MADQRITVVNEQDEIIDYKVSKTLAKEEIYRVAALWITNSKGDVLLAQRAHQARARDHGPDLSLRTDRGHARYFVPGCSLSGMNQIFYQENS